MQRLVRLLPITFIIVAVSYVLPAYGDDDVLAAKWQVHQIRFHYSGFGTHYTCDGIRYKLKLLLREFGARDDVRIEGACTSSFSEIQRFHNLLLAFAVPVPAAKTDITEETFPAKWERIRLRYNHPRDLGRGECELVEQFNRQVVSKIGARDVVEKVRCIPRKHSLNSINLELTVLKQQEEMVLEPAQD